MKRKLPTKFYSLVLILFFVFSCDTRDDSLLVSNVDELNHAVKNIQAGQTIMLANGEWEDVELVFKGIGNQENPIRLTAEEAGKVIITGESNLQISGEHLIISDLIFKNGYTPTNEVISFKTSKKEVANYTRLTNCVIDNFSNSERFDSDIWVSIYGKNNQIDHNSLIGKKNSGVTMAVRMNTELSRENNHIIEYNYFGPRQILGSNGGETLRIGTSHYSKSYSNTVVQKNFFDRCNGEHEIISNKTCGNNFLKNVFFECQGTLTMRHGHHTLVEGNYFLGNRQPNTGGIRIINEYQTVKNNYLYGLTGHRFRGALVIMNGVPNSPLNRYNQVIDSHMDGNVVIESDYIQLCAGSDEERSATPVGSSFVNNIILGKSNLNPFTVYDDISGIIFENNILNKELNNPIKKGFSKADYTIVKNKNGLKSPDKSLLEKINFGEIKLPVLKEETGASYHPIKNTTLDFKSGNTIKVTPGKNTILKALESSNPGDELVLENNKTYLLTKYAFINHPISIKAEKGEKAIISSSKSSFFKINNGGSLSFENILLDGEESPDQAGNNVISTSKYSMNTNYSLVVKNCEIKNLDKNHTFDFLKIYQNTFADSIIIRNTKITNVTGSILSLNKEIDDLGIYNVENIVISDSDFKDIRGSVANIYRGGTDESTFGPMVKITNSLFDNVGFGKRNKSRASLKFHGVQKLTVKNSNWNKSAPLELFLTNGEPITQIEDCQMVDTEKIRANNNDFTVKNVTY